MEHLLSLDGGQLAALQREYQSKGSELDVDRFAACVGRFIAQQSNQRVDGEAEARELFSFIDYDNKNVVPWDDLTSYMVEYVETSVGGTGDSNVKQRYAKMDVRIPTDVGRIFQLDCLDAYILAQPCGCTIQSRKSFTRMALLDVPSATCLCKIEMPFGPMLFSYSADLHIRVHDVSAGYLLNKKTPPLRAPPFRSEVSLTCMSPWGEKITIIRAGLEEHQTMLPHGTAKLEKA